MASPAGEAMERVQAPAFPAAAPDELLRQLTPLLSDYVAAAARTSTPGSRRSRTRWGSTRAIWRWTAR